MTSVDLDAIDPKKDFSLPLEDPIEASSGRLESITFKPLTAFMVKDLPPQGSDQKMGDYLAIVSAQTGLPLGDVFKLGAADSANAVAVTGFFLRPFLQT